MQKTAEVIDFICPLLPDNKTRYTMGVGLHPKDLIEVVARGIDIFDCVAPTRNARHGTLYCGNITKNDGWVQFENLEDNGKISIKKSIYAKDEKPIMPDCGCYTCKNLPACYYLFKQHLLPIVICCIHNIHVMHVV